MSLSFRSWMRVFVHIYAMRARWKGVGGCWKGRGRREGEGSPPKKSKGFGYLFINLKIHSHFWSPHLIFYFSHRIT